jgi:hypothetical protein
LILRHLHFLENHDETVPRMPQINGIPHFAHSGKQTRFSPTAWRRLPPCDIGDAYTSGDDCLIQGFRHQCRRLKLLEKKVKFTMRDKQTSQTLI